MIVLRYSDAPLNKSEPLTTFETLLTLVIFANGVNETVPFVHSILQGRRLTTTDLLQLMLHISMVGTSTYTLVKAMSDARNERSRSHELESKQMGFNLKQWHERSQTSRVVAAGSRNLQKPLRAPRHGKASPRRKSHKSHKRQRR